MTNYLLVCSAMLVPDPPFSSKTRVYNSTVFVCSRLVNDI